jgi:PAS domain S-box-containing protein
MSEHEQSVGGLEHGELRGTGLLNEATLRALIERIPLTVYIDRLDEVSSNVYTSPQLGSVLGYSVEEWASDEELFLRVIHPDDRGRVLAEHRRTRETGEPLRIEYRMIARDGTVRWFRDEAAVIPDESGTPKFHYGYLHDITERRELEDALRRSEDELRRQKRHLDALLEISPTAIVTLDLDGKVTSWNLAAEELFGYTSDEAVGRDLEDLIADRDDLRAEAVDYYAELVRANRFHAVTRRVRKDGSLLDVELFAVPIAVDTEPSGYLVVYRDVTAISAQLRAEKRYRELVEQLPLVTYVDEPAAAPSIYISPQVESLVGYSADEWLGDPELFLKLLHPDDRERVLADHERVFAAGESSWSFEYRLVARDGRTVWLRDDAVVIKDDEGNPLYVQGFLMDVTKRKEVEEALRRSEMRFRAMFEEAPIGVAWGPLDKSAARPISGEAGSGLYTRNRAYTEMLGYTEEELASMHFTEYTHPEDLPKVLKLYGELIAGERDRYEVAMRYLAKDGREVWAQVVESAVRDEQGASRLGLTMVQDITERKEAEDALRRSEADLRRQTQYYESLLEISPVAVVTLDLEERVTSWNPAAEKLFGYSEADALGQMIGDLILRTEALRREGVSIMQEAIEEGSSHRITRRMRKDGALVDVEVLIVPLRMDGESIGSYAIYHDISELHRQKQYFESLLEISPTAIITVDLEDKVTSWNPAAEKLFGYPRAEAMGHDVDDLVAASDEVRADAADVNRRGSEGEVELITRRTHKDGSLVDVHVLVAPVFLEGDLVGRYGIYHDISELQRQKQYFQSLLDNSPTAIAAINLDDTITAWNPAAEKLFGYTREEAIGRKIDNLVANSAEVRAEAAEVSRQALETGQVHLITRRTRKDGSLLDVELLVAPVVMGGRVEGFYAIYHDIGELVQARREAEEATQAKSAFLATMSHEIRTPMNAVIGMTELLLDTELAAEQRGFADVIRTSGDSLLTIIDDILDFSKIEAGRLELEYRPFILRDCVESALDIVAASASAKGIDLAFLLDPEAPAAFIGDPTRLRQILGNLLTNAVKFTGEGEVVLSVGCEEMPSNGERAGAHLYRLSFAVRDTGIGIPADRMDRLFQSFSQVDASTTRRYGGTGLGLAISKRLSEMMGGRMWVESGPGAGSTFHFTVTAEAAPSPLEPAARRAELKGKRLLVVDDNAANREVVRRQSTAWGMTARDTGSPTEALEWIRRGDPFDVAILDMQMPEMDGLSLAHEIRRSRDARSLPLVLLTSLGRRKEDLEAGVEFGAYLTKPIKASQLFDALIGVFGGRAEESAAIPSEEAGEGGKAEQPRLRILVAEDNEVNQKLALLLLRKIGYGADLAANGLEALEALRRERYDVVLMDVEMPVMDGLEASRSIHREWPGNERPRIIALTANAMQGDRETCLAAGMDDYLSKPIHADELAAVLARSATRTAAPEIQDGDVLDASALEHLEVATGDPVFVAELVDTFLREAPELVTRLKSALQADQADELRRAAHTLKSNARTFGAAPLADLCQALESAAKAGATDEATQLVARIEHSYARVEGALAAVRAGARRD